MWDFTQHRAAVRVKPALLFGLPNKASILPFFGSDSHLSEKPKRVKVVFSDLRGSVKPHSCFQLFWLVRLLQGLKLDSVSCEATRPRSPKTRPALQRFEPAVHALLLIKVWQQHQLNVCVPAYMLLKNKKLNSAKKKYLRFMSWSCRSLCENSLSWFGSGSRPVHSHFHQYRSYQSEHNRMGVGLMQWLTTTKMVPPPWNQSGVQRNQTTCLSSPGPELWSCSGNSLEVVIGLYLSAKQNNNKKKLASCWCHAFFSFFSSFFFFFFSFSFYFFSLLCLWLLIAWLCLFAGKISR